MPVRITDIRETHLPHRLADPQRLHRLLQDDRRAWSPSSPTSCATAGRVIGYGFNSNGRYGQGGLIRERFAAALLEADPGIPARCDRREPRPRPHLGAR